MALFQDPIMKLLTMLKTSLGGDYKAYYEGDPIEIGQSSLPCIIVMKQHGNAELGPTGFDRMNGSYLIKVVMDKRDDFGASPTTDLTDRKLRQALEGRDTATGLYLSEAIIGLIRKNYTTTNDTFSLNPTIQQNVKWQYWVVPRPNDIVTNEAHITIDTTELLQIPNRA